MRSWGSAVVAAMLLWSATWARQAPVAPAPSAADWPVYRGDPAGSQFANLAQIHAANVHTLRKAWEFHTGDGTPRSTMHANPIVIDGVMYLTTPSLKAVALDAATGREIWTFDPARYNDRHAVIRLRNRGVAYWKGAEGARIFDFVKDRVYAIDAKSGALITTFGKGGFIDLRENLGVDPATVSLEMTSPGAVYKNFLILGSRVNESYDASPGHIRAFDVVTGQLRWIFHTIPAEGEFGRETLARVDGENYGGGNAWGGITIDERRGWVFAATGSITDDFYGAFRKGEDLFSDSVLALDAATGQRKWHYQTVHHDIWDYDNPPAPILVTITAGGAPRDVVVQLTKMGFVFVLDRDTGTPVFPVIEKPVPASTVPGEAAWPTQPFPLKPPALVRQYLSEADLTNITPAAHAYALNEFRKYTSGVIFTPPTLQGTVTQPGHLGGSEWHGGSFDPWLNVLYVNVNDAPTINKLRPVYDVQGGGTLPPVETGRQIYEKNCAVCHGADRQGTPPQVPSLLNLKLTRPEIQAVVTQGRNSMPAFGQFHAAEMGALVAFVTSASASAAAAQVAASARRADRYTLESYIVFTDEDGVPATAPPWGTLNAVDLARGDILWKVPLGEYPQLVAKGIRNTGSMNYGGAVATAGGVVFIAATADEKIRAFEASSGRVLWESTLPVAGYATPAVYLAGGKEYVVIAAGGGGKNGTKSGDSVIAFALPDGDPNGAPGLQVRGTDWLSLFDGKTLDGWVHLNGGHTYTVEDGAIVGRTVERSANINSFLCTTREFGDFELELETMVDPVTNQGIQIRSRVRPVTSGRGWDNAAGRVFGPQVEVRRFYPGMSTTGLLYGEALGTGWISSQEKMDHGHHFFVDDGWNSVRIVARGPRIQTWVNGHPVEDLTLPDVYKTHPSGFIGLQLHGITQRDIDLPVNAGSGVTSPSQPLISRWRNIRIRPL
jgi:quinoprotein glucose dehydrogenase